MLPPSLFYGFPLKLVEGNENGGWFLSQLAKLLNSLLASTSYLFSATCRHCLLLLSTSLTFLLQILTVLRTISEKLASDRSRLIHCSKWDLISYLICSLLEGFFESWCPILWVDLNSPLPSRPPYLAASFLCPGQIICSEKLSTTVQWCAAKTTQP